eukprot:Em0013g383a
MTYGRTSFAKFKAVERRKVIGKGPYMLFKFLPIEELAKRLMKSMKAPRDVKLQYTKHIAILRNFIRHGGDTSNLYEKFKEWLCDDADIDWKSIVEEDSHIQYQAGASQLSISDGLEIQDQGCTAGNSDNDQ